jgi:UDPglucose--hexose-1-phosphate uridylyltransferase
MSEHVPAARPELRQDPTLDRWTVVAPERGARPGARLEPGGHGYVQAEECPFCGGREYQTPPELAARRDPPGTADGPGWRVRVIPNRFPAVRRDVPGGALLDGLFRRHGGHGAHELILEAPEHVVSLTDLSPARAAEAASVYRERVAALRADGRFAAASLFKNVGPAAGASVEHTHSQLIALPVVPRTVVEELDAAERYRCENGRCLFCDLVERELAAGRLVRESMSFVAVAPYASRVPYETWIFPRRHGAHFDEIAPDEAAELGAFLHGVLTQVERVADRPAYNFYVHAAPFAAPASVPYHWHLEVVPRTTTQAGFEWGTGFAINPLPPEVAAARLRDAAG